MSQDTGVTYLTRPHTVLTADSLVIRPSSASAEVFGMCRSRIAIRCSEGASFDGPPAVPCPDETDAPSRVATVSAQWLSPGRAFVVAGAISIPALLVTSCSGSVSGAGGSHPTRTGAASASHPKPLGAEGCRPPSPMSASSTGFRQVEGTAQHSSVWGLLDFSGPPRVATVEKVVWRMTGSGSFRVTAVGPGGRRLRPTWGPEIHGSSNWDKPGQEWGTGFTFTQPGCWDLIAARRNSQGQVWLQVAA
jgi:hypothetical protein